MFEPLLLTEAGFLSDGAVFNDYWGGGLVQKFCISEMKKFAVRV